MGTDATDPDPREMRRLGRRSDARGAARTALHLGLLAGSGALLAAAPGALLPPALLLLGAVRAALFAPLRETTHHTAFRSRRANAAVGWIAALPSSHHWRFFQQFRLAHHRHTQDPRDDPGLPPPPPRGVPGYLARMAGLPFWKARLRVWADGWRGDLSRCPFIRPAAAPVRLLVRNMPVHAERHLFPFIPFHRPRDAPAPLRGRLGQVGTGCARWRRGRLRAPRGGAS